MEQIFELSIDLEQNIDEFPNIHKINANDYLDLTHILNSEKHEFQDSEIIARGNFLQLNKLDFISNNLNIPIFSNRVIKEIEKYNYSHLKIIPLKIYDDTEQEKKPRMDFFTIDFRKQFNFLNLEKSEFRKLRSQPEKKGILRTVVIKEISELIPVVFRVKESISKLFITENLLDSFESNSLRGIVYKKVVTE